MTFAMIWGRRSGHAAAVTVTMSLTLTCLYQQSMHVLVQCPRVHPRSTGRLRPRRTNRRRSSHSNTSSPHPRSMVGNPQCSTTSPRSSRRRSMASQRSSPSHNTRSPSSSNMRLLRSNMAVPPQLQHQRRVHRLLMGPRQLTVSQRTASPSMVHLGQRQGSLFLCNSPTNITEVTARRGLWAALAWYGHAVISTLWQRLAC